MAPRWRVPPVRFLIAGLLGVGLALVMSQRVIMSMTIGEIADEFGYDSVQKGYALSAFFTGYIVLQVVGGTVATIFGAHYILGIGMLVASLSTMLTPSMAGSLPLLVAARALTGLGQSAVYPSVHALLGQWAPAKERSVLVSAVWSGAYVGTTITFPMAGAMIAAAKAAAAAAASEAAAVAAAAATAAGNAQGHPKSLLAPPPAPVVGPAPGAMITTDTGEGDPLFSGWQGVFHLVGCLGVVWSFAWLLGGASRPEGHAFITAEERAYIVAARGGAASSNGGGAAGAGASGVAAVGDAAGSAAVVAVSVGDTDDSGSEGGGEDEGVEVEEAGTGMGTGKLLAAAIGGPPPPPPTPLDALAGGGVSDGVSAAGTLAGAGAIALPVASVVDSGAGAPGSAVRRANRVSPTGAVLSPSSSSLSVSSLAQHPTAVVTNGLVPTATATAAALVLASPSSSSSSPSSSPLSSPSGGGASGAGPGASTSSLLAPLYEVPWRLLLTHPAVWALAVGHTSHNWLYYVIMVWGPQFLTSQLGYDAEHVGLAAAVPYVACFFASIAGGAAADYWMHDRNRGRVRKVAQTIGEVLPAIAIVLAGYATTPFAVVAMLTAAVGLGGVSNAGFASNHLDIAPRYAGILLGLANTLATLPGIVAPVVVGALVSPPHDDIAHWRIAFWLSAGICVAGWAFFVCYAQGDPIQLAPHHHHKPTAATLHDGKLHAVTVAAGASTPSRHHRSAMDAASSSARVKKRVATGSASSSKRRTGGAGDGASRRLVESA